MLNEFPDHGIIELLKESESIAGKARKHGKNLYGTGFYANKFSEKHAKVTVEINDLISKSGSSELKEELLKIKDLLERFYAPSIKSIDRAAIKKELTFFFRTRKLSKDLLEESPPTDDLIPLDIVKNTRDYIEKVAIQACGCYDKQWCDASAVMCRRLLETLIIEIFEAWRLSNKIKNPDGSFFYLSKLIPIFLNEQSWNISRNAKSALPKLKDLGDTSAHSRRYIARKSDLDIIRRDLRIVVEELIQLLKSKWSS